MSDRVEHGPSEASEQAIEAARAALSQNMDAFEAAAEALDAAHDPALGLDRSVCLRDVVDFLNQKGHLITGSVYGAAGEVERHFTEQGPSRDS